MADPFKDRGIILDIDEADGGLRALLGKSLPRPGIWGVKVGDCILKDGVIDALRGCANMNTFVDLKHGDTPDRMERIMEIYARLHMPPTFVSVCGFWDEGMLSRAVHHAGPMQVIMVTVPSHWDDRVAIRGYRLTCDELLSDMEQKAYDAGVHGITCPAWLLPELQECTKKEMHVVATGVRSRGMPVHNHAHPVSSAEAFKQGATHAVVGREITRSETPIQDLFALADACQEAKSYA